jgi:hypothetical protein
MGFRYTGYCGITLGKHDILFRVICRPTGRIDPADPDTVLL